VLLAVGLYDQPALQAREVRDERADRMLAAELVAAEAAIAQARP
jgi:hypothetical protein